MRRSRPAIAVLVGCAILGVAAGWRLTTSQPSQRLPVVTSVVVVGVPGLAWSDLDPATTPQLLEVAEHAALGSLTTRGAGSFACPLDGWVTLGAGNRALYPDADCPRYDSPATDPARILSANARQPFDAQPGLLGTSVACAQVVGQAATLAVIGASKPPAGADCPLTLIAAPVLPADNTRSDALARVDALVGRLATRVTGDPETLLLVAGVSDSPGGSPQMHLAMAVAGSEIGTGPGSLLRSASTGRVPYVQLIDVAPTVLASLGATPPSAMAGRPMVIGGAGDPLDPLTELVTAETAANAQQSLATPLVVIWIVLTVAFSIGAVFIRRSRKKAVGVAVAAIPLGSMLANLLPWERTDSPELWLGMSVFTGIVGLTAVALAGPWRAHPWGPQLTLLALGVLLLGSDVATGSSLQLHGLLGYNPIVAGRFTGLGNMPFGLFATCGIAALASSLPGRSPAQRRGLIAVGGGTLVLLTGLPGLGSDVGGVLALAPALLVMAMMASGVRLSPVRLGVALSAGVVAMSALAVADYHRAADDQTHLGRFVGQVLNGGAATVVERKAAANMDLLLHSPVSVLAPVLLAVLGWLFYRPDSLGRQIVRSAGAPGRAAAVGIAMALLLGSLLNDSGIAIFVSGTAVLVPLLLSSRPLTVTESEPSPAR